MSTFARVRSTIETTLDPAPENTPGTFEAQKISLRVGDTVLDVEPEKGFMVVSVRAAKKGRPRAKGNVQIEAADPMGVFVIRVPV